MLYDDDPAGDVESHTKNKTKKKGRKPRLIFGTSIMFLLGDHGF